MSENYVAPRTTQVAFKLETTEGTAPTDAASDSILTRIAPTIRGFSREFVDREIMIGNLGRLRPLDAGPSDPGVDLQVECKGSGTHGTAPEIGQMLECSFGAKTLGVTGTVAASPAQTTTAATVTGATTAAGQLADIEVTTGVYETRRIITSAAGPAVTYWPPVSAALGTGANVFPGVSYLLTSQANMKSGSAFFYFENGEKCIMSGLRGNPTLTFGIREPLLIDFAFNGIKAPATSQTAIGYTWAPPDFAVVPPVCLAVELRVYLPAKIKTATTTTSIILKYTDGLDSYFEATAGVDKVICNVGSSVWETRLINTWTYSSQTAAVTAFTGDPADDSLCYLQRNICIPNSLVIDPGHVYTKLDCMNEADGWVGSRLTSRESTVTWDRYFRSFVDYRILQKAAFVEMWAIAGSTRGNKIAVCIPNVFHQEHELDLGGEFGMVNMTGGAYSNSATGNDEMYLTFL